jgi:toxin ParE1/3/4
VSLSVVFTPEAEDQLRELHHYIAAAGSAEVAACYAESIVAFCEGLGAFPLRGRARDDIRPGLRTIGFKRRVVIAFAVLGQTVVIVTTGRLLVSARPSEFDLAPMSFVVRYLRQVRGVSREVSVTRHRHHRRIGRPAEPAYRLGDAIRHHRRAAFLRRWRLRGADPSTRRFVRRSTQYAPLSKACAHSGSNVRSSPAVVAN